MACTFLNGNGNYQVCLAYDDAMILSVEELAKFCHGSGFDSCPIFQKFRADGIKIPVDQHSCYKHYTG